MKEAVARKRAAYKELCKNSSDENKTRYKTMKNQTKKVVARAMRRETEKQLKGLEEKPNGVFKLVKCMKKDGKDVDEERCIRGRDGRLAFSEKDRAEYGENTWSKS